MKIILIVGPSGAGKDTLLRGARDYFRHSAKIRFVRRYITRPPDINEDNYYIDLPGFLTLNEAGFFVASWNAHSNHYGVARHTFRENTPQATVICSISRTAIEAFERAFPDTVTINVTVPKVILQARLRQRGRENDSQLDHRLARADKPFAARNLVTFDNSRELTTGVNDFINLLDTLR